MISSVPVRPHFRQSLRLRQSFRLRLSVASLKECVFYSELSLEGMVTVYGQRQYGIVALM